MPPLDEGDLLYMPSALPGLSAGKAAELLQQTDRLIKTVPEVASVFGKAGRAETATDPAPLEMFETTIQFKPREQWRAGMTPDKLVEELDRIVQGAGAVEHLGAADPQPHRHARHRHQEPGRREGRRAPTCAEIDRIAGEIERVVKDVPGVTSALAERLDRRALHRRRRSTATRRRATGSTSPTCRASSSAAIGGENIGETVEGLQRFPINVRYPRELRDSVEKLRAAAGRHRARRADPRSATSRRSASPTARRCCRARTRACRAGSTSTSAGATSSSAVRDMQRAVARGGEAAGRATRSRGRASSSTSSARRRKLKVVVPFTLLIIFVLLYLTFRRVDEALLIMATLPFALVGGFWLLWLLGHNVSVASAVGFIALAGVAAEFGVIMLLYLKHAWERAASRQGTATGRRPARRDPRRRGAARAAEGDDGGGDHRRPAADHVRGSGTGSEVMQRIAAPMVGGMITAPLLSMFVVPAAYLLMRRRRAGPVPQSAMAPAT